LRRHILSQPWLRGGAIAPGCHTAANATHRGDHLLLRPRKRGTGSLEYRTRSRNALDV